MRFETFKEILKDNRGKETNLYKAGCCFEGEAFIIYINFKNEQGYIKTDSILDYIEDEASRPEYNDLDFEDCEVWVKDSLTDKLYKLYSIYDDTGEMVTFAYKDWEGVELFKSKKDFNSIKNTYKEILNRFELMDLNIDEIEELVDKTEVNGIDGFQKLILNTKDCLYEKDVQAIRKRLGIKDEIELDTDFFECYERARPDLYIKILSEKDFYYIAYSVSFNFNET